MRQRLDLREQQFKCKLTSRKWNSKQAKPNHSHPQVFFDSVKNIKLFPKFILKKG